MEKPMMTVVAVAMERAKEYLKVAEMALEGECYNGCSSNAYYAMFWAASEQKPITSWKE